MIGAILTPICRPAVSGCTPLALIDATSPGTGKILLTDLVSIVATGRPGALFSAPKDPAEWGKKITTALLEGVAIVAFDNITKLLDSDDFCKAFTAEIHADRAMATHKGIRLEVRCSWIANGNNIQLGGDMPRRCYWIRMDAKCAKPSQRDGFRHDPLTDWVISHRPELLGALLTLARGWFDAGQPPVPSAKRMGRFDVWARTIGGILHHAGVEGFLGNSDQLVDESDAENSQWGAFLLVLDEIFYSEQFLTVDIVKKLKETTWNPTTKRDEPTSAADRLHDALPDYLAEGAERGSLQRRLGKAFAQRVGRRFGSRGYYIMKDGDSYQGAQYWKVMVTAAEKGKAC